MDVTIYKTESLGSGLYRIHSRDVGYIDVRAKYPFGWNWILTIERTNVLDMEQREKLIALFIKQEGME